MDLAERKQTMSASKPNSTVVNKRIVSVKDDAGKRPTKAIKSNSRIHPYEKQANTLLTVPPSAYEVGNFIWGIEDEWTEEYSDFTCYIWDLVRSLKHNSKRSTNHWT